MQTAKSVVITCAGIGSRLGMGTTKALLEIDGRSLISWQMELFRDVEDVRVVVGYQANDVVKEVLKYRSDAIFIYNHNYFDTKTGASFYLGSRHANEFVVKYDGDLLVHPEDMKLCLATEGEYIGYSDVMSDDAIFVTVGEQGDVLGFSRRKGDFEWAGPACIRRDTIKYTSGTVYNQLEDRLPMKGIHIRACDIDTYTDYERAVEMVRGWQL
ncbi:NTP transferase domain-containing protein [Desulfovibrio sp. OttesenSCG-928-C06]|nr:NTP transferase domain-containing protein [Desulfovibrio sp. OttesenSCG-928-C06]